MIDCRERLARWQKVCPVCELPIRPDDTLHHWLIRRMKSKPELDEPGYGVLLLHQNCHVPEPPQIGYKCAVLAFTQLGISPEQIESWVQSLDFKVTRDLPWFYYEARSDVFGY